MYMPESWCNTLSKYKYECNLANYSHAQEFSNHFNRYICGDRDSTINFENYFRDRCSAEIQPWYEIVFWKMYSQGEKIRNNQTDAIVQRLKKISPTTLFDAAIKFMACKNMEESRRTFEMFQQMFYRSKSIATVATIPAFLNPQNFPMVDTQVARWVTVHYAKFNSLNNNEPKLIPSPSAEVTKPPNLKNGWNFNLNLSADFEFYWHWIQWTREYAQKLNTYKTNFTWRARDVEMAVFTAWRNGLDLNPL